jgi:hypothetical protein
MFAQIDGFGISFSSLFWDDEIMTNHLWCIIMYEDWGSYV